MKKNLNQIGLLLIIFSSIFFSSGNKKVTVQANDNVQLGCIPAGCVPDNNIRICHATGSDSNPYVDETVDYDSIVKTSGHDGHEYDIIPPFTCSDYPYPGKNWDLAHQVIWNNGCNPVTPGPPPVDCEYEWSECSVSCGGGTQTLEIIKEPENGGIACPIETTRSCNTQECPVELVALKLTSMCHVDDVGTMRLRNPNSISIETKWQLYSSGTWNNHLATAGDSFFEVPWPGTIKVKYSINDKVYNTVKAQNNIECEPTGTPEVTETPSPTINPTPTPTNPPSIGGGNPPGPPVCTDPKPGTPTNLIATWVGSDQVRLNWTAAAEPHTSYVLAYGPSTSDYRWGSPNIGNGTEYIVGSLTPGLQYCFYIYAQNNCMPGDRSNEVCVNQGSAIRAANVLGATDNYNPLVSGIKDSYGGMILGETTEMPQTAEVKYSAEKLPSGNTMDTNHSIVIPSLNLAENVYIPQKIGDEFVVGHQEVLYEQINGNEVYYGHNGTDVFGNLYRLNTGEKVEVTEDGVNKTYLIEEKLFVHKSEVNSLETGDNQIVLTTCSYTQPDFRIVIKATLIK